MNPQPFFPDPIFAWLFYLLLVGICVVATVVDYRYMIIPKWLTLPMFGLGILFNVVRGAWMGAEQQEVWLLEKSGAAVGALDGLLFALAGFAACFAIWFTLWMIGGCSGGDTKLFASLGAWVGPYFSLWIYFGSIFVLVIVLMVEIIFGILTKGFGKTMKAVSAEGKKHHERRIGRGKKPSRFRSYSFMVAVSTALVLLWFFRTDLQLAPQPLDEGPVMQETVK